MKYLLALLVVFGAFTLSTTIAFAAPTNSNNPNLVANYSSGDHTVIQPDGSIAYGQQGADSVLKAGNSGNFQQWYNGDDGSKVHTLFKNVGDNTSCKSGAVFLENPYQPPSGDTWGTYFPNGDNYCAKSN